MTSPITGTMGKKTIGTVGAMLGIPAIQSEFSWSLLQLAQYTNEYVCAPGEIVHWIKSDQSFHMSARNQMVKDMLGDWLLMLDTDHAFAPDLLARMILYADTYKVDVLSGLYHSKTQPHFPIAFMWNEKKTGFCQLSNWDKNAKIFEVSSVGAGCLFVRRNVYDRIYKELKEEPFSIIPPFGEDNSFFKRLDALGIKAYVAPGIQYAHLATRPITSDDYVDRADPLGMDVVVDGR